MKPILSFKTFLSEKMQNRIAFSGKTASDLYKTILSLEDFEIFADGVYYTIPDINDFKEWIGQDVNMKSDVVYLSNSKTGNEKEIKVSNIEFIQHFK